MNIRIAAPDDCAGLAEIQRASVDVLLRPLYDGDAIDAWLQQITPEKFERVGEHGEIILLAEEAGEPLGFVSYCSQSTILGMWYVRPQHVGKGIGAALLAEAERAMRAAGCRKATTEASTYARPAFQALGWIVIDEYDKPAFGGQFRVARMAKSLAENL